MYIYLEKKRKEEEKKKRKKDQDQIVERSTKNIREKNYSRKKKTVSNNFWKLYILLMEAIPYEVIFIPRRGAKEKSRPSRFFAQHVIILLIASDNYSG